jgi:glycosyltransferase involved in cell wall biosynthesis
MPDKKLLLVGNGNHQFIRNYVEWLKKENEQLQVSILSDRPMREEAKKNYDKIYQINFNTLFFRIIKQIKGIRSLFYLIPATSKLKEFQKYDFIHIHRLSIQAAFLIIFISKFCNAKIITTVWGSDFYKNSKYNKKLFFHACNLSDTITFANKETKEQFLKKFRWEKNNISIQRFGLAPLEQIKKLRTTKHEAKRQLGWDGNKLAVTIGYNLYPNQQHIHILKQIDSLTNYSDKIELIIPITYGGNEYYKMELLSEANKLPYTNRLYDQFLSDEKIALIRLASDIMIQLQVTDQLSGSMQEHLFTRNVVITGSWLPYQTMIDYGIEFIRIDSIEELSDKLEKVINQYDSFYQKTTENPEAILKLSSWESNISDWIQLYE